MTTRDNAILSIVDPPQNLHLDTMVTAVCDICLQHFVKPFKYIMKCTRGGKTYRCRACSNTIISRNQDVISKRLKTISTPEHMAKISKTSRELWKNTDYRNRVSQTNKILANSVKGREQRSKQSIKAWKRKEYRDYIVEVGKNSPRVEFTDEVRKKLSDKQRANWLNEELRAKYIKGSIKACRTQLLAKKSNLNVIIEDILGDGKVGGELQVVAAVSVVNRNRNQSPQHQLSNQLGGRFHALFVLFEDFDIVINKTNYSTPNSRNDH